MNCSTVITVITSPFLWNKTLEIPCNLKPLALLFWKSTVTVAFHNYMHLMHQPYYLRKCLKIPPLPTRASAWAECHQRRICCRLFAFAQNVSVASICSEKAKPFARASRENSFSNQTFPNRRLSQDHGLKSHRASP